jgi:cobalt-zinc-cadmium efflux system outer membrane protein
MPKPGGTNRELLPLAGLDRRTRRRRRSVQNPGFRLLVLLLGSGLTACASYHPAPIDPTAEPAAYFGRRITDSALIGFMRAAGDPPDSVWHARHAALAALYYQPELDRMRASLGAARAGEITAGSRPQPGVSTAVEQTFSGGAGQPPWGIAIAPDFTVELGGKRGARLAGARAQTMVSDAALRESAWRIVTGARAAAFEVLAAEEDLIDARAESEALGGLIPVLENRFREGGVSQADLAQAAQEAQVARLGLAGAERRQGEARASLARAIGLPIREADQLALAADSVVGCAASSRFGTDSLRGVALHARWNLARAFAEYLVAEADLRLQIAKQYPDLSLAPGLFFDHGANKWTLGFALPTIPINRNRGPIGEAEARRLAAGSRVAEVQDSVLADLAAAEATCLAAAVELTAADSLAEAIDRRIEVTRASYARGEIPRANLSLLEALHVRAVRARHQARQRLSATGLALEAAGGVWLEPLPLEWPDPARPPGVSTSKEASP